MKNKSSDKSAIDQYLENYYDEHYKRIFNEHFDEFISDTLTDLRKENKEYETVIKEQSDIISKNDNLRDVIENDISKDLSKQDTIALIDYFSKRRQAGNLETRKIFLEGMKAGYSIVKLLNR